MSGKLVGTILGCIAIAGVLVWGLVFDGFTRTPSNPSNNSINNNTNTNPLELTGSSSIGVGSVKISNYIIGTTATFDLPIKNGKNVPVSYVISCRQPDATLSGYIKAPAGVKEWFQIPNTHITLQSGTEGVARITMLIPANTPESIFIVYYLTDAGKQYLNNARENTLASEDALAAAFKEELIIYSDIYEQFDELYANRGDKYIFKAIYDAFPQYYSILIKAWERAIMNVKADLSAIPYVDGLATLERLGSISEADVINYPELSELPEQYVSSADLRKQPWEFWITVMEEGNGLVQIELACRWLVHME